ncbi:MAG: hypothetical protein ACREDH_12205 [Methylocella sp.]
MAKRRPREIDLPAGSHVVIPDEQPEKFFDEPPEPGTYAEGALAGLMTELGAREDADAKVTVKKIEIKNGTKKELWLFECEPEAFSIADVQEHYGEGEYRIVVYGKIPGTNYRTAILANKRFSVAGLKDGATPKALSGVQSSILPAHPAPSFAPEALAKAIAESLAVVFAPLMRQAPTRADTLAELREMGAIFSAMRGAVPAQADPIDMLARVLPLLKSAAPAAPILNDDGEVSENAVLNGGISLVRELFAAARDQKGAAPTLLPSAPGVNPVPADARIAPPAAPEQDDAMLGKLLVKTQLVVLLNAAKMDSDPETYAALIYEQAPDEVIDKLQAANWFEELLALEPAFAPYRPWVEKVRVEVLAALAEESDPDLPSLTPGNGEDKLAGDAPGPSDPAKPAAG